MKNTQYPLTVELNSSAPVVVDYQHQGGTYAIVTAQGNLFAKTYNGIDACLIAAAPDLLASLQNLQKKFVEVSEHFARKEGRIWVYGAQENCAALNAITKATGGQS